MASSAAVKHSVVSADLSVGEAAAFLERLQAQARAAAANDDAVIDDEMVALLPDASDEEEDDGGGLPKDVFETEPESPQNDENQLPGWLRLFDANAVVSSLANVESFFAAVVLRDGNLKFVFCLCLAGQVAMYINLLLVQMDIEDTGLFLVLLQLGAVLLGLQSAQGIDHFKQAKKRGVGDGDAGKLLYKLTKRMSFHAKMIFFPMLTTLISMVAFCSMVYSLVLRYGDCNLDVLHVLDGAGHLSFEAFGFDQLGEFATWTIYASIFISPLTIAGLGLLSYMHFVAWGTLAESWEKTRQMFASFDGADATAAVDMFDPAGRGDMLPEGLRDQLPIEKVFELKALKYVAYLNYFFQLLLFGVVIWRAQAELMETHILYGLLIIGSLSLGYQMRLMVAHRDAHKNQDLGRSATQRGARWHGRMLFYPCLALIVLTFVYMTSAFALFHYYRDPAWIPENSNSTNTTSSAVTSLDGEKLLGEGEGEDGSDEERHCPRTLWEAWGAMTDRGYTLLSWATVLWLLTGVTCTLLALQHYHLYREVAQRHCSFEAEPPDAARERDMWAKLDKQQMLGGGGGKDRKKNQ